MPRADWLSTICIVAMLVVVAVVAVDRNRMKQRLNNAEGRFTGLSLDVNALRDRVTELTSYLNRPSSWAVDAQPPTAFADVHAPDRWDAKHAEPEPAPAAPEHRPDAGEHVSDPQRSAR